MAELAIAAVVAGGLMSAAGTIQAGNNANKKAKIEAAQMESQANSVQGDSQREMLNLRKEQRLAQSALLARAAVGGGATDSAGFNRLYGDIEAQGDYNALTALYNGNVKATGLRNQAAMTRYEGQLAKKASKIEAVAGLLQTAGSAGSMYAKYGAGGSGVSGGIQKTSIPGASGSGGWSSTPYSGNNIKWG